MATYRVLIRREMIEEAWIEVEARGRVQAQKEAVKQAKEDRTIAWHATGTPNTEPYPVQYMKRAK